MSGHAEPTLAGEGASDEFTRVLEWRYAQLVLGGYGPNEATALAGHLEVDLHRALDFLRRGCPPEIASEILL